MSKKLIIANWKSHKTLIEAMHWLEVVGPASMRSSHTVVLCPPTPFLVPLWQEIEDQHYNIELGVQDISPYPAGSYTGAVTARNLEGLHVNYAILGHVEQRTYFGETNQRVANKVTLALESEITPIVCIDKKQLVGQSAAIETPYKKKCIVSFEPSGHIGTGEADSVEDVLKMAEMIRGSFTDETPVIYGGSVDSATIKEFLGHPELSGVLVGTASLDAQTFAQLLV